MNKNITNKYIKAAESKLPTKFGSFSMRVYKNPETNDMHFAIYKGNLENKTDVLCRVHSSCITGDILGSMRCDCGDQLAIALKEIQVNDGIVIYLFQEGRGIGLINKIKAYELQEQGLDTVEANLALGLPADARTYEMVPDILEDLNIKSIRLMTNNPSKINELKKLGVVVSAIEEIEVQCNSVNEFYLKTKKEKMDHQLHQSLLQNQINLL